MSKRRESEPAFDREQLERLLSADIRAITAQSDRVGRHYARINDVNSSDFHALLHIMVAETAGKPLTLAQLRQRMDVSPAAITYLVDRLIQSGHIRREPDPADRRKWMLRYENRGMSVALAFFTPLAAHFKGAMADLPERDLMAAHHVFQAMIGAMTTFEEELHEPGPKTQVVQKVATPRRRRTDPSKEPTS